MTNARRRGRPAPLRWGGSIALAGIGLALIGGYLQFDDRAGATPDPPAVSTPLPRRTSPSAPAKSRPATSTPVRRLAARPGKPLRLSVPQLQVSAPVVGITIDQGALTPPSNPQKLGWWSGGAQPGAKLGSAVITGHTVHTGGGAFDNLNQLQPGDSVGVTTTRGQLGYRVTSVTTYRKQTLAKNAQRVFDQSVPGRLVLITCEDWNGKVYLSNTVVIAQRVA
ncbi:class F sortase [Kribbella monticola]|uniref:class F sortase n=1 Tax=Kribbella monticola TaxID=2185285 RepID=UPI001E618EC4|nr:class F sortase [Kribbella monticola]